jgi:SRSO17 transposase
LRIKYFLSFELGTREAEMKRQENAESAARFEKYVEELASVIGHADRVGPLHDYCTGLVLPGDRKSVEPMAAKTDPARLAAQHQSLLHFVGIAEWSDERVLGKVRELVLPAIERHGPIEAWIIDDTSFPKQGRHSVGVQHQYCGQLGKQANCQVAVTLSLANHHASLPVAYRLYLPKDWVEDGERRTKAHIPAAVGFKTKPQIALEQLRWACEAGLAQGAVMIDPAYGNDARLRTGVTALGLTYVAGIQSKPLVWPPGTGPRRRGKPINNTGRRDEPDLVSVKKLALALPEQAWRTIRWREGSADWLSSRFARVRVRAAHGYLLPELLAEEWLLIEWPEGEADQILALDAPREHRLPRARGFGQAALAHRARLPGAQAGGRAWTLRGARLARIPSSRNDVHRRIRVPDLRAGDDSPLSTSLRLAVPETCPTRRLSTPRIPPCGLNGTFQTRSQPCAFA